MLGRSGQVLPELTFTKFAPARPDATIKWPGAQIWQGPARLDSLLVADCIDEDWAKLLATAYNSTVALNLKVAAASQVMRDFLNAVSASAAECQATDPRMAESLSSLVAAYTAQAKKAGLSPL